MGFASGTVSVRPSARWTHAPRFHGDERQRPFWWGGGVTGKPHKKVLLPQLHIKLHTGPLLHGLLQDGRQIISQERRRRTPAELPWKGRKGKHGGGAAASPERPINQQRFGKSGARNAGRHEQMSIKPNLPSSIRAAWRRPGGEVQCCNPENKQRDATGLLSLHKHGCCPRARDNKSQHHRSDKGV